MFEIIPSIASADPLNIGAEILKLKNAPRLHLDIEDGNFVPNITFGIKMIKAVSGFCGKRLDVHIMANDPMRYFDTLKACGVESAAVHFESLGYPLEALNATRNLGMKPGLALNFKTGCREVLPFMDYADYVLIMTAEPDGNGEKFNPAMLEKIKEFRNSLPPGKEIWVDGSIGENELPLVLAAGADKIIMGRYLFSSPDPAAAMHTLYKKYS